MKSYSTGTFDLEATPESQMRKLEAQKSRKDNKMKAQILPDNTGGGLEGVDDAGEDPLADE